MDRKAIALKRMKDIAKLPLDDREAIPHEKFMELTKEFLELNSEFKKIEQEAPPT